LINPLFPFPFYKKRTHLALRQALGHANRPLHPSLSVICVGNPPPPSLSLSIFFVLPICPPSASPPPPASFSLSAAAVQVRSCSYLRAKLNPFSPLGGELRKPEALRTYFMALPQRHAQNEASRKRASTTDSRTEQNTALIAAKASRTQSINQRWRSVFCCCARTGTRRS
jgi:hypothetical protein